MIEDFRYYPFDALQFPTIWRLQLEVYNKIGPKRMNCAVMDNLTYLKQAVVPEFDERDIILGQVQTRVILLACLWQ
jgi:uncharacterized protein Smg (DUF494 family)